MGGGVKGVWGEERKGRREEGDWEAEKGRVGMYQRELWVSERGTTRELVERGRQRKRGLVCTREILSYGGAREGTRGGRRGTLRQRKGGLVCMRGIPSYG